MACHDVTPLRLLSYHLRNMPAWNHCRNGYPNSYRNGYPNPEQEIEHRTGTGSWIPNGIRLVA